MKKQISQKTAMTISIVISYVTLFASVILAIFYTPYVLEKLGETEYGVRAFATAFIGYLSFLSIGMATSYLRFANIAKKDRGEEGEKHINGIFFAFYLVVAAIASLIGAILILLVAFKVIPLEKYTDAQISNWIVPIMTLTAIGTVIEFPGIVFRLILTYKRKFIWTNLVSLIFTVLSPMVSMLVLFYGGGSVAITWVALGISIATVIVNGIYVFFGLKTKVTFKFDKYDKTMFRQIIVFSLVVFAISILTQMNLITNKVIIGFMIGSQAVAIYQISTTFNAYIVSVSVSITSVFGPQLTEDAVRGRMDEVQYIFDFVIKVISIVIVLIVFGFMACGFEFVSAWLPASYSANYLDIFWYSLVILGSNILIAGQTFSFQVQRALNKNLIPAIIYACVFVINVALGIGLCYVLGIWGCIIGTVFSYTVEAIALSFYNSKKIKLKQKTYWKSVIFNALYGLVAAIITSLVFGFKPLSINLLIDLNNLTNISQLLVKGFTYVGLFSLIQIIFNRRFIKEFFHTLFSRKPFPLDEKNPLQILIPTMHKNGEEEIRELLNYLNVKSSAIVANQTDRDQAYTFVHRGKEILVIDSTTKGVSRNRNILLENLSASIGLFIDDDCALLDDYENKVVRFFLKNKNDAVLFNGLIFGKERISKKRTAFVIRFSDVSHVGGPGVALSKKAVEKYNLRFNEALGTPNFIYSGEDSVFMHEMMKKRLKIFRSSKLVFDIIADAEKSSYFKGFDEQYFVSKGAVNKLIHPRLYRFYEFYYAFRLQKKTGHKPKHIFTNMKKGEKFVQNGQIVYDEVRNK